MCSQYPKVLHSIGGKSLLRHVYDLSEKFENNTIHVVIGHGAELVKRALSNLSVHWVEQLQQLGTGHAVQQVADEIDSEATVLILYGDVPLLQTHTLQKLL